jgi:hypothetical protein
MGALPRVATLVRECDDDNVNAKKYIGNPSHDKGCDPHGCDFE